jgi:hypothetical protein
MITPAIKIQDWLFNHCQDYLVDMEMVVSVAIMSLRLAHSDINEGSTDCNMIHLESGVRDARTIALKLRQNIWTS